mmetsp:Transcript_14499/g.41712  ORF Transcript_14499/g.41712 Transcript_14499/m.41712 type:complete len:242 (+) Transcript_14499:100-825(+)
MNPSSSSPSPTMPPFFFIIPSSVFPKRLTGAVMIISPRIMAQSGRTSSAFISWHVSPSTPTGLTSSLPTSSSSLLIAASSSIIFATMLEKYRTKYGAALRPVKTRSASKATPSMLGDVGRVGSWSAILPARRRSMSPPVQILRSKVRRFLSPPPLPGPRTVRSTSRYPPSRHCRHSSVSSRSTANRPTGRMDPKFVERLTDPFRWVDCGTKWPWNHRPLIVGRRRTDMPWRVATGGPPLAT